MYTDSFAPYCSKLTNVGYERAPVQVPKSRVALEGNAEDDGKIMACPNPDDGLAHPVERTISHAYHTAHCFPS